MKSNKGISLVLLIFIVLLVIILATVGILAFTKNTNNDEMLSNVDENITSENEIVNNDETSNTNKSLNYWVLDYNFPEETKEFSLNLYDGTLPASLNLTDLEEVCDYFTYHNFGEKKVSKISDIQINLASGNTLSVFMHNNDDSFAAFSSFEIKNFSEEAKSAQECIENGWWYILKDYSNVSGGSIPSEYLGIEVPTDYTITSAENYNENIFILEEVVKKLGRPTKILSFYNNFDSHEGFQIAQYDLVYEYSDFVFCIKIMETIDFDNNYSNLQISSIEYITPQSWEHFEINKPEKYPDILN